MKKFLKIPNKNILFVPGNYQYVNEGNYTLKIDGGRQKDRQTDRQTKSLIEERSFAPKSEEEII